MIVTYPKEIEQTMKEFFNSLSEKDRRRYAAVEAHKLGHAVINYWGVRGLQYTQA